MRHISIFTKKKKKIKFGMDVDSDCFDKRVKYGFKTKKDIENHYKKQDKSGKTLGCGCIICKLRHDSYISKILSERFHKAEIRLSGLYNYIQSLKKANNFKDILFDLTAEDEPFTRYGYYILMKKLRKINDNTSVPDWRDDPQDIINNISRIKNSMSKKSKERRRFEQKCNIAIKQLITGLKLYIY